MAETTVLFFFSCLFFYHRTLLFSEIFTGNRNDQDYKIKTVMRL